MPKCNCCSPASALRDVPFLHPSMPVYRRGMQASSQLSCRGSRIGARASLHWMLRREQRPCGRSRRKKRRNWRGSPWSTRRRSGRSDRRRCCRWQSCIAPTGGAYDGATGASALCRPSCCSRFAIASQWARLHRANMCVETSGCNGSNSAAVSCRSNGAGLMLAANRWQRQVRPMRCRRCLSCALSKVNDEVVRIMIRSAE